MNRRIFDKFSFNENKRRYLNLRGILSRRYAYKGPDVIQIDLTNRCDSHCLACWLHSPFIDKRTESDNNKEELDFLVLKSFISDAANSGVRELIFSGGGEPFFYSRVWETLEVANKMRLPFRINTSLSSLGKNDIKRLLSFDRLVSLTISIWASDAAQYSKLHNRDMETFYAIKENIRYLNSIKLSGLEVKICAVINNNNYFYLRNIATLAGEIGCDAIEFTVIDIVPGITDSLSLGKEQLIYLRKDFVCMVRELKNTKYPVKIINPGLFVQRLSSHSACIGKYDISVGNFPCYAGWFFLRLRANGDFNSCLKSHRLPVGSIYKDDLASVWNNPLQQEFRRRSLNILKNKIYFRNIGNGVDDGIGCRRICDNIVMNRHLHGFMKYLNF